MLLKSILQTTCIILIMLTFSSAIYANPAMVSLYIHVFGREANFYLKSIDTKLAESASEWDSDNIDEEKASARLMDILQAELLKGIVESVFFINPEGKVAYAEPEKYHDAVGLDLSQQEHIQAMIDKPQPVFSKSFMAVEGMLAVVLAHPVFSKDGKFIGSISAAIEPRKIAWKVVYQYLYNNTQLKNENKTTEFGCEVWIAEPDGTILYHPEKDKLGTKLQSLPVFTSLVGNRKQLQTMLEEQKGKGTLVFPENNYMQIVHVDDTNKPNKGKIDNYPVPVDWLSAEMHGNEWRLIIINQGLPFTRF